MTTITGGCYCGDCRFEAKGDAVMKAQCHCRECQYITGGGPNYFMIVPADGVTYTKGAAKQFARDDLEAPRTRDFCPRCGTHMFTRLPDRPLVVVKVGTLDDPAAMYAGPDMAIFTVDAQPFHDIPEGMPSFERLPQR